MHQNHSNDPNISSSKNQLLEHLKEKKNIQVIKVIFTKMRMSLALTICSKFLLQERLQISFEEQQKQNPISHKARLKKSRNVQEKSLTKW